MNIRGSMFARLDRWSWNYICLWLVWNASVGHAWNEKGIYSLPCFFFSTCFFFLLNVVSLCKRDASECFLGSPSNEIFFADFIIRRNMLTLRRRSTETKKNILWCAGWTIKGNCIVGNSPFTFCWRKSEMETNKDMAKRCDSWINLFHWNIININVIALISLLEKFFSTDFYLIY